MRQWRIKSTRLIREKSTDQEMKSLYFSMVPKRGVERVRAAGPDVSKTASRSGKMRRDGFAARIP